MYLLLAVFCSTSIMLIFKILPRFNVSSLPVILANYVAAIILGIIHISASAEPISTAKLLNMLPAYAGGVFFVLVFLLFSESARTIGIAITSVSSKMSIMIPVLAGILFWNEPLSWNKSIGVLFAMTSFGLILYKPQTEIKKSLKALFFPLLLLLGNGTNDIILKIAQSFYCNNMIDYFGYLLMVFMVALIVGSFLILFVPQRKELLNSSTWLWGFLIGTLNWYSTYFFMLGLKTFDISVFIPIFNVGIVSFGALFGFLIFKEPFYKINLIGYLFALLAITLISL
jgi:drug/metabolite transporter (DMT)-like permease